MLTGINTLRLDNVRGNVNLLITSNRLTICWKISDLGVVRINGLVTRLVRRDVTVVLTVSVSVDGVRSGERSFFVTVKGI